MFLLPLPIVFFFLVIGFLLWFIKKNRKGLIFFSSGCILLFIFSFRPVSHFFMYNLEHTYKPLLDSTVQAGYIAVLGGGAIYDKSHPPTNRLSQPSLARLVEGVRLHRLNPHATLIFSGNDYAQRVSLAEMNAEAAVALGVDKNCIRIVKEPRDTEEEAVYIKKIIGDKKFILVTSAEHMKRSFIIFNSYGMNPIPAPTDFLVKKIYFSHLILYIMPSAQSIKNFEIIFHEYLGIIWFKFKSIFRNK
jgi:uncharacterized SAM-binding protein YcdF (DUF218 family)